MSGAQPKIESYQSTICIDLDGTLADYDGWDGDWTPIGEPIDGAREFCEQLAAEGWRIIIHTCRGQIDQVEEWLAKHRIRHDGINCVEHNANGSSSKPIADVYLDDRAVRFEGRFDGRLMAQVQGHVTWWEHRQAAGRSDEGDEM